MNDHQLLQEAGEALYGERWQTDMSRALNVSDRTIRRLVAGATIPGNIMPEVADLIEDRVQELQSIAKKISAR